MGDEGEFWNHVRKARKEKRASNREESVQMLSKAGIEFESKNLGSHLIVKTPNGSIDFWPGTGLWTVRRNNKTCRGAQKLIQYIRELK